MFKLPFTSAEFASVFEQYNEAVFPAQVGLFLLACLVLLKVLSQARASGKMIPVILALLWAWMGVVYHAFFFSRINPAAYGFAGLFVIQAVLFFMQGVVKKDLVFRFRSGLRGYAGLAMMVFALIVYPVLGYINHHYYPASPTFGLPCPTTIFTFGVLLLAVDKVRWFLLVIPLLWSVIGFSAALTLGMTEDISLLAAALVTLFIRFRDTRPSIKRPDIQKA